MLKFKLIKLFNKYNLYLITILLLVSSIFITKYFTSFKNNQIFSLQKLIENTYLNKTSNSIIQNLNPRYETIKFKVQPGDSFEKLINQLKIGDNEKNKVLKKVFKIKFVNKLQSNKEIVFKIDNKKPKKVLEFSIEISKTKSVLYSRNIKSDKFTYKEIQRR